VAESWLASLEGNPPEMVLFATTSVPQRDTDYLQRLRAAELDKVRGKQLDSSLLNAPRSGADNVYDYQVRV
jgi:hypothetical protein